MKDQWQGRRYDRTIRHEWPDQCIIETNEEAQDHATQWLWTYKQAAREEYTGRQSALDL